MIRYISTRGGGETCNFEKVLLGGLAPDGGLYVPQRWPLVDIAGLKDHSYIEIAETVMFPFVEGCLSQDDFRRILEKAYSQAVFQVPEIAPLRPLYPGLYVMELFHGPTLAFKDIALQLLGRLFDYVLEKRKQRITIIGATSGDTGSAAIEGCRHTGRADIFILFPEGRVSEVQRRQMTTVEADNVHSIALKGTFDDCQNAVKAMFGDQAFRTEMNLSAVNSINWARIMAQIVYYFTAALKLGTPEKEVTFIVPTGNFGNVFAGYCARQMGLPVKLVIATNKNDILTRFFETGRMEARGVNPTLSPSMDIEISSNFERYLFELLDRNAEALKGLMRDFKDTGKAEISSQVLQKAKKDFAAFRTDEAATLETIKKVHTETGYVLDPHTAVGMKGALAMERDTSAPVVVVGTAHPAKFPDAVEKAAAIRPGLPGPLSDLMARKEHYTPMKNDLAAIKNFVKTQALIQNA